MSDISYVLEDALENNDVTKSRNECIDVDFNQVIGHAKVEPWTDHYILDGVDEDENILPNQYQRNEHN